MSVTSRSGVCLCVAAASATLALAFHSTRVHAAPAELFISEYVEGTSNNKAIEIYNRTGGPIDLGAADYDVQMYFNGATTAGTTVKLTGVVQDGDAFVLAHASASPTILAVADQTSAGTWYNGDDAVILRRAATIVDAIGQIGVDPGTEWGTGLTGTADNTLRRDPSLCGGDGDGGDAFDPSVEWAGFAVDSFDGLGAHTATCVAPTDPAPSVSSTLPTNGATAVPVGANLTVTFSEPVKVSADSFTLSCTPSGAKTFVVSGGPLIFTIDPAVDFVSGDNCTLGVLASGVTDLDTNDPPDVMVSDQFVTFSALDVCTMPYSPIFAIQGAGTSAAITGPVQTRGVVVGDFEVPSGPSQLRGFYIQDPAGDGNAATSDAIFVFNGGTNSVNLGDLVHVSGTVAEFQEQTQVTAASVVSCGVGTVAPVDITLPLQSSGALEAFEGMLVRLPQTLSVTEHFQLGRFGQVVVSSGGPLKQPTQMFRPGTDAAALQAANDLNHIIIDDDSNAQNPDPIAFGRGGQPLSASNTLRSGDTATGVVGVLTYTWSGNAASGNAFRVRPIGALTGAIDFTPGNPRPSQAPESTGSLRVASMNLLNFFNTFGSACTNGVGGPATDCRGADNAAEFARQWPKTVAAMVGTGADVIGALEMENDGYGPLSAITFLVDRLNDATAPGTYDFIDVDAETGQTNALGTDAIKAGLIYKPARVTPVGQTAALNSTAFVNGGDLEPRNRPSLAQAFEQSGTGARFVVDINHLKSKGSACDAPDAGDGQGNCNTVRVNAANELISWLAGDPTGTGEPDVLIMGDLNAYAAEDPVIAITSMGYTNTVPAFGGDNAYSYAFDGQWGSLDHALASESMASQISNAEDWFINADEPAVLDYNTDFKTAGQLVGLYAPDVFRMSDHNPLIVDLMLDDNNAGPSVARGLGSMVIAGSAGLKAGDTGSKMLFALGARFAARIGKPAGHLNLIVRQTETDGLHVYGVRSRLISSLLTDRASGKATIIGAATLRDITHPGRPILLEPNGTVRMTLKDNGAPGGNLDTLGVEVRDASGQLWFSSNWNGRATVEQTITSGNVRVR